MSILRVDGETSMALRSTREPTLSAMRRRIASYVEAHLDDPDLSIDAIASAVGRSPRYLHKAFDSEAESLSQMIWRLRLERSAGELRRAEMADRSITDIAFASGFNSSPHFSRAFRARYGMAPRDWRKRRDAIPGASYSPGRGGSNQSLERKESVMTTSNESLREQNRAVAHAWLSSLFEPEWWDLMHDDIVLEFPYGPSIGASERVAGKEAASAYCKGLLARAGKLKFSPLEITGTTDPSVFFSEYECDRVTPNGSKYKQIYIQKTVVRDGKVMLMREFWDPKKILDAAK